MYGQGGVCATSVVVVGVVVVVVSAQSVVRTNASKRCWNSNLFCQWCVIESMYVWMRAVQDIVQLLHLFRVGLEVGVRRHLELPA